MEFREGDALETLKEIDGDVDMVLLDGAFTLYLPVLKLLEPHLREGALIVEENAFEQLPGYLDYVRDPQNGYLSRRFRSMPVGATSSLLLRDDPRVGWLLA